MLLMAKEKRRRGPGRPKKYPVSGPVGGRSGSPLSIRIDPELRAAVPKFQALFKKEHDVRLDITDVVELAIRQLFRKHGILPPEPGKD